MSGTMIEERLHELFAAQAAAVQPSRGEWDDVIVDDLAERRDQRRVWTIAVAAAACVALVVALGWAATRDGSHPPASGNWLQLSTDEVLFAAESVVVEVAGREFSPAGELSIHSDPDPTEQTLELRWNQHGVEMRLNFYFVRDRDTWGVTEVRIYDGTSAGDWLILSVPVQLNGEVGVAATGDLDLRFVRVDGVSAGRLIVRGFELQPYLGAARGPLPEAGGNPPPPVGQPVPSPTTVLP